MEENGKKKLGRPTDNPKPHKISARINESCWKQLNDFCKKKGVTQTEAIAEAIKSLAENPD